TIVVIASVKVIFAVSDFNYQRWFVAYRTADRRKWWFGWIWFDSAFHRHRPESCWLEIKSLFRPRLIWFFVYPVQFWVCLPRPVAVQRPHADEHRNDDYCCNNDIVLHVFANHFLATNFFCHDSGGVTPSLAACWRYTFPRHVPPPKFIEVLSRSLYLFPSWFPWFHCLRAIYAARVETINLPVWVALKAVWKPRYKLAQPRFLD